MRWSAVACFPVRHCRLYKCAIFKIGYFSQIRPTLDSLFPRNWLHRLLSLPFLTISVFRNDRIVCGAESKKRYGVRQSDPSFCPSVCPIRPLHQRAAGLLLWARRVGDIDCFLYDRCRSMARSRKCGQCHAFSVPMLLNTDLLFLFCLKKVFPLPSPVILIPTPPLQRH